MTRRAALLLGVLALAGCSDERPSPPQPTNDRPAARSEPRAVPSSYRLDAKRCEEDEMRFPGPLGSSILRVNEKRGDCIVEYGYEIEDPTWDGEPSLECRVPAGRYRLPRSGPAGLSIEPIERYCTSLEN